jgi:putative ABC transport system substrate-binding protein
MKRRELIALLGGAAAWPVAARAQQPAMPVIGFLNNTSPDLYAERMRTFLQGLNEVGYVEGQNVVIEYRWSDGKNDRLPALAAELVGLPVSLIFAAPTASALAAKAATATIPIVFTGGADPVASGLVASLNRPGGNLTGVSNLSVELGPKQLELLHELIPTAIIIGLLVNPTNPNAETQVRDMRAAARALGQQIVVQDVTNEPNLEISFATLMQRGIGALLVLNDVLFNTRPAQLVALAARHAIPAIYSYRNFTAAGGLMSYGTNFTEPFHLAGMYAGRILKGAKPVDLPVQQATKIELVINLKTAKTLRLTFPITLLGRADEIIE